ncbi:MAG: hypothetical protein ACPG5T_06985, partial [Endozoicomonas sp.]
MPSENLMSILRACILPMVVLITEKDAKPPPRETSGNISRNTKENDSTNKTEQTRVVFFKKKIGITRYMESFVLEDRGYSWAYPENGSTVTAPSVTLGGCPR